MDFFTFLAQKLSTGSLEFISGLFCGLVIGYFVFGLKLKKEARKSLSEKDKQIQESRKAYELIIQESKDNLITIIQEKNAKIQELRQKLGAMQVAKIADDINAKIQKNKKA